MTSSHVNQQKKRISVTIWYISVALLWCLPSMILVGLSLPAAITGNIGASMVLTAIHAIILGVLLTAAAGVLWQFVPIAFQARPLPRHVLYWHLPTHTLSVLFMSYGFLTHNFDIVAVGGSCLMLVTLAYGTFLVVSLRHARNRTPVFSQLGWPLLFLPVIMFIGILLAAGMISGSNQWLATHAVIGLFGFWALLVIILSYKFFPMFALSHGYQASPQRVVRLYLAGLVLLILGIWSPEHVTQFVSPLHLLGLLGAVISLIAELLFVRDASHILRARKRKRLAPALSAAICSTVIVLTATTAAIVSTSLHLGGAPVPIAYAFLIGGLIPLLLSYLHKIVPFLRFEFRFSHAPDRKAAPALDDMVQRIPFVVGMSAYGVASALSFLLLCFGDANMVRAWGSRVGLVQALGVMIIGYGLLRILRLGGPRPD
ncbi:MAG: hypothetical protein OWU32_00360 [Firmicutes bacterium]|nr:hypothetical protein [Bacillota bacterium]